MITNKKFYAYILAIVLCVAATAPCVGATGGYDPDGWSGAGHVHQYTGEQVRVEPTCETDGYIGVRCAGCDAVRQDQTLSALGHNYVQGVCSRCSRKLPGDMNSDAEVNNADVVHLLWHVLFPQDYSVDGNGDVNMDGEINNADVTRLLWYVLFPEQYPL